MSSNWGLYSKAHGIRPRRDKPIRKIRFATIEEDQTRPTKMDFDLMIDDYLNSASPIDIQKRYDYQLERYYKLKREGKPLPWKLKEFGENYGRGKEF